MSTVQTPVIVAMLWILLFGAGTEVAMPQVWLVVGASDASPAAIARKAKTLSADRTGSLIFDTRDCGDKQSVFGWAAEIASSEAAAQEALARTRASIKGAYLKRCKVRAGSLLAVRYSAVDLSVADVPDDAVNWSDEDRVSSAAPLASGRIAVIARYYVADPNDSLEGRRERLMLIHGDAKPVTLMDPCLGAGPVSERRERVAFHCAREQAADQDLHSTFVYDTAGKLITEIPHCSDPSWVNDRVLKCSEESIGPDGLLSVRPKKTQVP